MFRNQKKAENKNKHTLSSQLLINNSMNSVSRLDITRIFCDVDDFCQQWEQHCSTQKQLPSEFREKRCKSRMSLSEIMTIVIAFHGSGGAYT